MTALSSILFVSAGAALGGLCRYGITTIALAWQLSWLGVLFVNVTGCFLAGLVFAALMRYPHLYPWLQPFFVVGFLGSLTTFSALSLDSLNFMIRSEIGTLVLNVAANVLLSLAAVWAGFFLARSV